MYLPNEVKFNVNVSLDSIPESSSVRKSSTNLLRCKLCLIAKEYIIYTPEILTAETYVSILIVLDLFLDYEYYYFILFYPVDYYLY